MTARPVSYITAIALAFFLFGCQTMPMREHRGAMVGAGVGGAGGAAAGGLIGGDAQSAAIGGLLGAAIGGAVGHYAYDQRRTREETIRQYGYYDPSRGTIVSIEKSIVEPNVVRPGDRINLGMTYAVITPDPRITTTVVESREVSIDGRVIARPENEVVRSGGTYYSSVPLRLPPNAPRGTYTVTDVVQVEGRADTRQSSFEVR